MHTRIWKPEGWTTPSQSHKVPSHTKYCKQINQNIHTVWMYEFFERLLVFTEELSFNLLVDIGRRPMAFWHKFRRASSVIASFILSYMHASQQGCIGTETEGQKRTLSASAVTREKRWDGQTDGQTDRWAPDICIMMHKHTNSHYHCCLNHSLQVWLLQFSLLQFSVVSNKLTLTEDL